MCVFLCFLCAYVFQLFLILFIRQCSEQIINQCLLAFFKNIDTIKIYQNSFWFLQHWHIGKQD